MLHCIFDKADGLYQGGARWRVPAHDGVTQVALELADYPDRRSARWDGAAGIRAATAQELADYDDEENDRQAGGQLNTPVNIVLRDLLWAIVVELRGAGRDLDTIPALTADNAPDKPGFTAALKALVKARQ